MPDCVLMLSIKHGVGDAAAEAVVMEALERLRLTATVERKNAPAAPGEYFVLTFAESDERERAFNDLRRRHEVFRNVWRYVPNGRLGI